MEQPEALRLADALEKWAKDYAPTEHWDAMGVESATELRRLHEVNQELVEACIEATSLFDNYPQCFEAIGTYEVLNQAILKATGETK